MGANVGDRLAALQTAAARLGDRADTQVAAASAVYETEALVMPGAAPQPDHLNAVVALDTALAPRGLLRVLHGIERAAGRDPDASRWSPRPLDLDLLLYGARRMAGSGLVVPHPALADRRFVLRPLADLAPDLTVPGLDHTVAGLLAACPDPLRLRRTDGRLL
jgi:2-amino-4-hydroxy-6-hydroxymethyldihydropteridine diphosphokinase